MGEDIILWCDGTWCYRDDLEGMLLFMSDDFTEIETGSSEWLKLTDDQLPGGYIDEL